MRRGRPQYTHDRRCDSDLCHPDCPVRRQAVVSDRPYPGSAAQVPATSSGTRTRLLARPARRRADRAVSYADAVVATLIGHPRFEYLATDTIARDSITRAVVRQATAPSPTFECIVDNPMSANWRLRPHRDRPGQVRLSWYGLHDSPRADADEQILNAALDDLDR